MAFNKNLRELRLKKGWSQEKLSQKLGVTAKTISFYETGDRKPSRESLLELAKIFDVTVDELLDERDELIHKIKLTRDIKELLIAIGVFEENTVLSEEEFIRWLKLMRQQAAALHEFNKDRL